EAVDRIEAGRQGGPLFGKIVPGTPAQNQHVDLVAMSVDIVEAAHRYRRVERLNAGRIATGVDAREGHVGRLGHSGLGTPAQIAIAGNGDSYLFGHWSGLSKWTRHFSSMLNSGRPARTTRRGRGACAAQTI